MVQSLHFTGREGVTDRPGERGIGDQWMPHQPARFDFSLKIIGSGRRF